MKAEYDLSKLKARKNPYASKLKKPVTMRLSALTVVVSSAAQAREATDLSQSQFAKLLGVSGCLNTHQPPAPLCPDHAS
jgi:DNA-binding transcriptional regulator YiaG